MRDHRWDNRALDLLEYIYPARGPRAVCDAIERELGWRPTPSAVSNQASIHGVRRARASSTEGFCELSAERYSAPEGGERWRVCSTCGQRTPEDSSFCCRCGSEVGEESRRHVRDLLEEERRARAE